MRVAVVSVRGGVAKTALAGGIGAALARQGVPTLVIDCDPQGSLSQSLGVTPTHTLASVLIEGVPITQVITEVRPGLSLIPADRSLAAVEGWLYGDSSRRMALRHALKPADKLFEQILLDTAPGFSLTNVTAYLAAHGLLVPCTPDALSLRAVRLVEENIELLRRDGLSPPRIISCIMTFADRRHGRTPVVADALRMHFGSKCGPPLNISSALAVAMGNGEVIFEMAPHSRAAADFEAIATHLRSVAATRTGTAKGDKLAI